MSESVDYDFLFKVVMIGDSGVGKSCLLKRFSDNTFPQHYISTIGVDFEIRTIDIEGKVVKLQIWDTAGQERFHNITTSYYRGAHCIMLVYDVSNQESYDNIPRWLNEVKKHGSPNVSVLLMGNKIDLEEKRVVTITTAKDLARELGLEHIECSAKDATNVEAAFVEVASEAMRTQMKLHDNKETDGLLSGESLEDPQPQDGGCC